MASASDDPIAFWLKLGALDKLEQALLDGYGDQLRGRSSRIPQVARFLKQVPAVQAQMEEMHEGAMQGRLEEVRNLAEERRQLAYCRDQQGASPLHKAVLFQQRALVAYFVQHFPAVMHTRDHQGRTPLHYAAVLQDNGEIYRMLKTAGSDENATDVYGHTPDFYLDAPGELTLEQLKEGTSSSRSKKAKHRRRKSGENSTASIRGYSAKPAGLKVQIREIIGQGNLEALEELVLHGHGDRLLGETSPNPVVQEFLDIVPGYIEQISDVHRAVIRGRLREVQTLMSHRSLSLARDSMGATPIHKAVMHGHVDVAQHLADNFRDSLSAKDVEGRTPLHYAAALRDGRKMYNMLIAAGSPTTIVDSKGKTADYYLQYPEKLGLEQIIKRNQLANATHLGNTVSRLKALAPPCIQKTIVNMHERYHHSNGGLNGNHEAHLNGDEESEGSQDTVEDKAAANLASQQESLKKVMMRTKPMLPPVILPRLEVNSANIRKWIDEQDIQKLEGAVFEGYGERLAKEPSVRHEQVEQYLRKDVPRLLERIQAIHRAVSDDDVRALESQLQSPDYALARDHLGMTPLHRAVVLGRHDVARLLVDRFPETINARDREGRTALHYAAAASRRSGRADMYRLLLQNGSDPRIRDNRGKSSEYYKTHHLQLAPEVAQMSSSARDKARSRSEPPGSRPRRNSHASTALHEKLTAALQKGDPAEVRELVLEGHGRHLLGRTSWNEEVRHLLKSLPQFLHQVSATHEAIGSGDLAKLKELAASDPQLLRARSDLGCHPMHAAIEARNLEAARLILDAFPAAIKLKAPHGRNPLHLAALRRDHEMYKFLVDSGADPKALDQKGKTAEYYLKNSRKRRSRSTASTHDTSRERSSSVQDTKAAAVETAAHSTELETITVPADKGALGAAGDAADGVSAERAGATNEEATEPGGNESGQSGSSDGGDRLNELIDVWIKEGDLLRLEHVVIAGQGERLLNKTSEDKQVQEFLGLVPAYMDRIRTVHEAVVSGNMAQVRQVLTRKRFALSRDRLGASPLHLAVLHGHTDVLNYIVERFPETLDGPDNEGRTPLHYAAVVLEAQNYFDILKKAGADEAIKDKMGHTPEYYLKNPKELSIRDLLANYHTPTDDDKSAKADVWQRPSTPAAAADAPEALAAVPEAPSAPVAPAANGGVAQPVVLPDGKPQQQEAAPEVTASEASKTANSAPPAEVVTNAAPEAPPAPEQVAAPPVPTEKGVRQPVDEPLQTAVQLPLGEHAASRATAAMGQPASATLPAGKNGQNGGADMVQLAQSLLLTGRTPEEAQYLSSSVGDALVGALAAVAKQRPPDPVAFVASWLKQNQMVQDRPTTRAPNATMPAVNSKNRDNEVASRANTISSSATSDDSLRRAGFTNPFSEEAAIEETEHYMDDYTRLKDEEGQTVLHFAASHAHSEGCFYALVRQGQALLAERDSRYRTARDVAREAQQTDNVFALDAFVLDAFLERRAGLLRALAHRGYEPLLHAADRHGRHLTAVLAQFQMADMQALVHDMDAFFKTREELHAFVRNGYLEGVQQLVKRDVSLVTAKGTRGRCALHVAVLVENPDVVRHLVKSCPDALHVADNMGRTPLHYAMAMPHVTTLGQILVQGGASRTARDVKMRTPSYFFIYKQEILKLKEEESPD
ncbi:serine/threonine-protein phosphatase 6 regulatory ankyrin repeat subunit C-like isoform X2 [Dermacentor albipictus]|uniref:serine/threonine-protein phosphatase 6 regulatory ankyrin repeat subunit C-like isoform X2 n=1 Tax=Dermacentor albipictus TaxID=60249 RepID=UPI0031FDD4B9